MCKGAVLSGKHDFVALALPLTHTVFLPSLPQCLSGRGVVKMLHFELVILCTLIIVMLITICSEEVALVRLKK